MKAAVLKTPGKPLEEMGSLALKAQKAVPMNAQCAVFAESEVISLQLLFRDNLSIKQLNCPLRFTSW